MFFAIISVVENKKRVNQSVEETEIINQEINLIEEGNEKLKEEINKIKEKINKNNNIEINNIKNKYKNEINIFEIEEIINLKNVDEEIEKNQNKLNEKIIINYKLETEQNNNNLELENLSKIEEEINILQEQYQNLINKKEAINLTKEILEKTYDKMKKNITPNFTKKLSENMRKISNNKYTNIQFNDEQGIIIEMQNGEYITINKLSTGTIDQLYISLRLSILEDITEESLPIILDESFAYFDNERLKNILQWLSTNYNNQIIIFTCTKREIEILNQINATYNLIELN